MSATEYAVMVDASVVLGFVLGYVLAGLRTNDDPDRRSR